MGVFIFSYHFSNEDQIKALGDEYAKYHEKIVHMKRSDEGYSQIAKNCEKIIADLRKLIVRSEVIYKNEQEQLNKSISVAMKAKEAIKKRRGENVDQTDEAAEDDEFDTSQMMDEMEKNPEVFDEIINEIDEEYDVQKLQSGYNKLMDLMKEVSEDENLRIGMFNIPD